MKKTGLLLSLFLIAGSLWAGHDDEIGRLYLKEAAFLYEAGDYDESKKLLDISSEFISGSSDHSFLLGMIEKQKDDRLGLPGIHFQNAIAADDWRIYSPADLAAVYIPVLFKNKQYRACLEMLSNPELNREPSAEFIWMHGKILAALDHKADAVDILREGLAFYPESTRLYGLLFELAPSERDRYEDLLLNGTINHPNLKNALIPQLIPGADDRLRELFTHYDENRLFDPACEIIRIRTFGEITDDTLRDLSGRGVFNDGKLLRDLKEALPFNYQRDVLTRLFNEWSGLVEEDVNGDGIAEYRVHIEKGTPVVFTMDSDQDGLNEILCEYNEGNPESLLLSGDSDVYIEYELHPWVKRISRMDEEKIIVYNLGVGRYAVEVPPVEPLQALPEVSPMVPVWDEVQSLSRNVLVYSSVEESPLEEYVPIFNGRGVTSDEPGDDGGYNRRFFIRDGSIEYMESDLTGAAGWDTIGYYQGGLLRLIAHDAAEDGIYEYAETAGGIDSPGGSPGLRPGPGDGWFFWDFNQNGSYDCRERRIDGRLLREYSSADNGVFDILIEIEVDS